MRWFLRVSFVISSLAISFMVGGLIARKYFEAQYVKIIYKGDQVKGLTARFKPSSDSILVYEWRKLPQEITTEKEKGCFRIIVIGDSVTYREDGYGLKGFYPKMLEDILNNQRSAGRQYEVINAGVPGYNTIQEVHYLEKRMIKYLPDLVIVGYCAQNDRLMKRKIIQYKDGLYCSDIYESCPYVFNLPWRWNYFLLNRSSLYRLINRSIVEIGRKRHIKYIINNTKYFSLSEDTEEAIKKIKVLSYKNGFDLLFVIFPSLRGGQDRQADWIVAICKKHHIKYIDLRKAFRNAGYDKLKIIPSDFCHPNKYGQWLAANQIFRYLQKNRGNNEWRRWY